VWSEQHTVYLPFTVRYSLGAAMHHDGPRLIPASNQTDSDGVCWAYVGNQSFRWIRPRYCHGR
jgi:hypothetical protein